MLKKGTEQLIFFYCFISILLPSCGEQSKIIRFSKEKAGNKISVFSNGKQFTNFLYPDTLEKPVLWPIYATNGAAVTRGFPLDSISGDPNDHPHHVGLWLTFENVNGLDFWNNSYAIPPDKKKYYGWVRTDSVLAMKGGKLGVLTYHANWTNESGGILLEETTAFSFSEKGRRRIIDRLTVLKLIQI